MKRLPVGAGQALDIEALAADDASYCVRSLARTRAANDSAASSSSCQKGNEPPPPPPPTGGGGGGGATASVAAEVVTVPAPFVITTE